MNATSPLPIWDPLHDNASQATPLRLVRTVVAADRAALSRLLGHGRMLALADGAHLQATPAGAMDSDVAGSAPILLHGQHGSVLLSEGDAFVRALTGLDLEALQAAAPAQREWLQGSLLGRLNYRCRMFGALHAFERDGPILYDAVTLRLTLEDGSHAVSTLASATAATWCALLEKPHWKALRAPLAQWHALVLRTPVRIGSHQLVRELLASLQAGDVVLPHTTLIDADGMGRLRLGGRIATIRCCGAGTIEILTLETAMDESVQDTHLAQLPHRADACADGGARPGFGHEPDVDHDVDHDVNHDADPDVRFDAGMDAGVDAGSELDANPSLDRVALRLDFSLGALALTLGQLRTLAPGAVLELAGASSGAVRIGCGDQVLGEGEAVDVGGRLGIRITRWNAPC